MPIYEYECLHCKNIYEALVIGEESLFKKCPRCGVVDKKQIVSASNFKVNGKYTAKTGYTYEGQNRPLGKV